LRLLRARGRRNLGSSNPLIHRRTRMMNELPIAAKVAQALLALALVAGSALVFQFGYYTI
jgi:hypothetical protein